MESPPTSSTPSVGSGSPDEQFFLRQSILPEVGPLGQQRIQNGKILIVGAGGLGCPALTYLGAAGVRHITVVDPDVVDPTNLHRQTLFAPADVGRPKVQALAAHAGRHWPHLALTPRQVALDGGNARDLIARQNVVLDCTDDPQAKNALADACRQAGIPLVQASALAWEGTLAVYDPPRTACLRCHYPDGFQAGATCATAGVLGPVVGILGAMQAQEALRLLLGRRDGLVGKLLYYDGLAGTSRTIPLKKRTDCGCNVSGACPLPWNTPAAPEVTAQDLSQRTSDFFLLDVREAWEFEEVAIDGSTLIPVGELAGRINEVPRDRPVVAICAVGGRSAHAVVLLRQAGIEAFNLRGGMRAWLAARRPPYS